MIEDKPDIACAPVAQTTSLQIALQRFNKAEPDLIVRDAFGHSQKPLTLGLDFLKRLSAAIGGRSVPSGAWWAIEYPFTSLAGALAYHVHGEDIAAKSWPNDRCSEGGATSFLASSGREDVDFVVSFDDVVILIEAKGYTSFDTKQVNSKLRRLRLIKNFAKSLKCRDLEFYFLIYAPKFPGGLYNILPSVARTKTQLLPMHMHVERFHEVLTVERMCKVDSIKECREFKEWRIISGKGANAELNVDLFEEYQREIFEI